MNIPTYKRYDNYKKIVLKCVLVAIKLKSKEKKIRFMIPYYLDKIKIDKLFEDFISKDMIKIEYIEFESSKKIESFELEWFDNEKIINESIEYL